MGGGGGGRGELLPSHVQLKNTPIEVGLSLCHNVLYFSLVVSMYSLYAYKKWLSLIKEVVVCNRNFLSKGRKGL